MPYKFNGTYIEGGSAVNVASGGARNRRDMTASNLASAGTGNRIISGGLRLSDPVLEEMIYEGSQITHIQISELNRISSQLQAGRIPTPYKTLAEFETDFRKRITHKTYVIYKNRLERSAK